MKALDKAKIALRRFLSTHKEKVKKDLTEMREKSNGKDIDWYVKKGKKN